MPEGGHPGGVEPAEEWLVVRVRFVHELQSTVEEFFIHRLHSLHGQRSGVLDFLFADFSEYGINRRVIGNRRPTVKDATRTELLFELRVFGIIGILRLLFRVEVIKIAEELVEPVDGGQEFVSVAQVILAELTADVALRLQQFGNSRILRLNSQSRPREANLGHASPDRRLPHDKRSATSGAALLAVPISEECAFLRNSIDVRRLVAHDAVVITAGVKPADVIAPDDEDVWLLV